MQPATTITFIFVKGCALAENKTPLVLDGRVIEALGFAPSDHYPITATFL